MYNPSQYTISDPAAIKAFIKEHSFGILVNVLDGEPIATHIPMLLKEQNGKHYLHGHVARFNEQWHSWEQAAQSLAIFKGPDAFVSSGWYKDVETVSTWNYMAVHVGGNMRLMNEEELHQHLGELTRNHELSTEQPKLLDAYPDEMIRGMMKEVAGFVMEITDMKATFKLSQNRSEADRRNIIAKLRQRGDAPSLAIAEAIQAQITIS